MNSSDKYGSISDRVKECFGKIERAAVRAGRNPGDITLVAAAKTQHAAAVREAVSAGITVIGENRAQEISEKLPEGAYRDTELRFIGTIQSNKINSIVGVCDIIESVGSLDTLKRISNRAAVLNIRQKILLEVNIGEEASKSGFRSSEITEILETASQLPKISVMGLMAIPPINSAIDSARDTARDTAANAEIQKVSSYFTKMLNLFIDNSVKKYDNVYMQILSMGMSGTFEAAIAEGATSVRLGTAIFGERVYNA